MLRDDGIYGDFVEIGTTTDRNYTVTFTDADFGSGNQTVSFFRFVIQAQNAVEWGPYSPVYRTQICGQPSPPASFSFGDYADDGVKLYWSAPTDGGCSAPMITKYEIFMRQTSAYMKIYEGPPSILETSVTSLTPGESYRFQITVSNYDQTSDAYPTGGSLLTVGAVPQPPGIPTYDPTYADTTNIRLNWAAAYSVLPILEYQLCGVVCCVLCVGMELVECASREGGL